MENGECLEGSHRDTDETRFAPNYDVVIVARQPKNSEPCEKSEHAFKHLFNIQIIHIRGNIIKVCSELPSAKPMQVSRATDRKLTKKDTEKKSTSVDEIISSSVVT